MARITIEVTEKQRQYIKIYSAMENLTMKDFILKRALQKHLPKKENIFIEDSELTNAEILVENKTIERRLEEMSERDKKITGETVRSLLKKLKDD